MYKSPSQNNDEVDDFLNSLENLLNNIAKSSPSFTVILGYFNARSMSWWVNDKTTIEGTCLEALSTFYGFEQLISVPTLLLPNSTSSNDLIFTDQPCLVAVCGVHPTLPSNCHHQIVHFKLTLCTEYPPPHKRLV